MEVTTQQVRAFRAHAQGLAERSPSDSLIDVLSTCPLQDSPPGSALLALNARMSTLTPDKFDTCLGTDKTLLQTWAMRGAPFVLATTDASIFTTGVLPPTAEARRRFIQGVGPALDDVGLDIDEATRLVRKGLPDTLRGRALDINELGAELASTITRQLSPDQRTAWEKEGPHAPGQPLGEAIVHFCLRLLTLEQVVCFAPRENNKAPFVLVSEWLDQTIPSVPPEEARAELIRRYLHLYGPSTKADFAAWLGVRTGDATAWWDLISDELAEVTFQRRTWILSKDLDALQAPPEITGVRLLPPGDPYTSMRDRDAIVDKRNHRQVWKPVGSPGTLLADGEIVGTWRPKKTGSRLNISVTSFSELPSADRDRIEDEAVNVAELRGASQVTVEFDTFIGH